MSSPPDSEPDVSTSDLLRRVEAAAENDPTREAEVRWELVGALHGRAEPKVHQAAMAWTRSPRRLLRCVGANILGQLGTEGDRPFAAESAERLVELLEDAEETVISAALVALGHLEVGDAPTICALAAHPSADVRSSVAFALVCREEPISRATLVILTSDVDDDVRNWATFGLAIVPEIDSPEIRAALAARINDPFFEVRQEAMVGLAARKDSRAIPLILHELAQDEVLVLALDAAAELPDPRFVPHLERLLATHPDDEELRHTVERCRRA